MSAAAANRVDPHAVTQLRERTGLVPAHAAQLLLLADGNINNALDIFTAEPNMFNISQHTLIAGLQPVVEAATDVPEAREPAREAPQNSSTRSLIPPSQPAQPSRALPCHSHSPAAKARRRKIRKEKQQQRALVVAAADVAELPPEGAGHSHGQRLLRAERVAFARGVAAEKLSAKQRRGAKRIKKKDVQRRSKAMARIARRQRAGQ